MGRKATVFVVMGQRFGRGQVINADTRFRGRRGAALKCDCRSEYLATVSDLVAGKVTSCGCAWRERVTAGRQGAANPNFRHGRSRQRKELYDTWRKMLGRCDDPDYARYPDYGGRGISVCARWRDVVAFVDDIDRLLGPRPARHTLDRIDNDGNYEPGNVRWATAKEQRANQRPYGTGALATVKRRRVVDQRLRTRL